MQGGGKAIFKAGIRQSAVKLVAIAVAVTAPAVHAEEPLVLKPLGRWVMDYADDSCALRRTFGSEAEPFWLEIRQYAPGDDFIATVASTTYNFRNLSLKSRFLPDGAPRDQELAAYADYADGIEGIMFPDNLHPAPPSEIGEGWENWSDEVRNERERSITALHLELGMSPDFQLETGELHKPMNAMRACLDDLLSNWGIDPQVNRTLSQVGDIKNIAMVARELAQRVPSTLVRSGTNARVMFRTVISENGKMETCRVVIPVVNERFETDLCRLIGNRAVFVAARDASGKSVRSARTFTIGYHVKRRLR